MDIESDKIRKALLSFGGPLCDDCLAPLAGYSQRQGARQRALLLEARGWVQRGQGVCARCGCAKTVTAPTGRLPAVSPQPQATSTGGKPWHWEGNVQAAIAKHLAQAGYTLLSLADTAARTPGKDIRCVRGDAPELWVTVKGFPEREHANTQARHWFAQALFDLVLYRGEDTNVALGLGLPAGFPTYERLLRRTAWFLSQQDVAVFLVASDGRVSVRRPGRTETG